MARRVDFLADYQNAAYAQRYLDFVDEVRLREAAVSADPGLPLTTAVARYLFKLMADKDEYEVARLYTATDFLKRVDERFEGDYRIHVHLAPPLWSTRNAKGELQKRAFGPWMLRAFRVLAAFRGVRGTWLDPFGHTAERREERGLIEGYERTIRDVLVRLVPARLDLAVKIAAVPEGICGYGHVKDRHLRDALALESALLRRFDETVAAGPAVREAQAA